MVFSRLSLRVVVNRKSGPVIICSSTDISPQVVLTMKARGIDDIIGFPLLSPPPRDSLRSALLQLLRLGALGDDGSITAVGRQMSRLPLPPMLSKVLIASATTDQLSKRSQSSEPAESRTLAAIDVVAALVSEPFFTSSEQMSITASGPDEADETSSQRLEARASLHRRQGDHFTYLAAIRSYACENTDRKLWADKHLINHRAMKAVLAVRKQLRAMLTKMKLLSKQLLEGADELEGAHSTEESERIAWLHPSDAVADSLLKCFVSALAPNVAKLCKDGAYRTIEGNHVVRVHPASVMARRKVEGIVYSELVFTKRNYARGVSAIQLQWYAEASSA